MTNTNDPTDALYEVEAYQNVFKDGETAIKWLDAKHKLLTDAGLVVVQQSMYQAGKDQWNANIQASRGRKPGEEPLI
jgi:hypothetical protein